jgi:hypothetical protein
VLAWLLVFFLTRSALLATHLADANVGAGHCSACTGLVWCMTELSALCQCAYGPYLLLCLRRLLATALASGCCWVVGVSLFVMLFTAVVREVVLG